MKTLSKIDIQNALYVLVDKIYNENLLDNQFKVKEECRARFSEIETEIKKLLEQLKELNETISQTSSVKP